MAGKTGRTREHEICDIAQAEVVKFIARAGFAPMTVAQGSDYGIDVPVLTFDAAGNQENGYVFLQIKGTERVAVSAGGEVTTKLKCSHLRRWKNEPFPVIVVRFDVARSIGYWIYVQRWMKSVPAHKLIRNKTLTLHIPVKQRINKAAILRFAKFKRNVLKQMAGTINHG